MAQSRWRNYSETASDIVAAGVIVANVNTHPYDAAVDAYGRLALAFATCDVLFQATAVAIAMLFVDWRKIAPVAVLSVSFIAMIFYRILETLPAEFRESALIAICLMSATRLGSAFVDLRALRERTTVLQTFGPRTITCIPALAVASIVGMVFAIKQLAVLEAKFVMPIVYYVMHGLLALPAPQRLFERIFERTRW